VNLLLP
jgi:hypothetical protein